MNSSRHTLLYITALAIALLTTAAATAQPQLTKRGIPYFRNYTADDYQGNNRNQDIATDESGHVFVANFEGLLYYDQATWHMHHLKNLTRPTSLHRDARQRLWVGGYNYFGRADIGANGTLTLTSLDSRQPIRGEVVSIWEENGRVAFLVSNDTVYAVDDNLHITFLRTDNRQQQQTDSILGRTLGVSITQAISLDNGLKAVATTGRGLFLYDSDGHELCNITEQNGLCSNNINRLAYNHSGTLWGATENGLFAMAIPSRYSRFQQTEGLHGEVYSITRFGKRMYVGTTSGLYRQEGQQFQHVDGINHLCWALAENDGQLLVGSEGGLYAVSHEGEATQLHSQPTRAILATDGLYYTGEAGAVYVNKRGEARYVICNQPNVTNIVKNDRGELWLRTLYGDIWHRKNDFSPFEQYKDKGEIPEKSAFPYSLFQYTDKRDRTWLTDNANMNLYVIKDGETDETFTPLLYALRNTAVRSILVDGGLYWIGGQQGLTVIDHGVDDPWAELVPEVRICTVREGADSTLWGGFGKQPVDLGTLESDENNLTFTFALESSQLQNPPLYQYRMDDGDWSRPSEGTVALFNNQASGNHLFQVRATNGYGQESKVTTMSFSIRPPVYMRWYMMLLYIALLVVVVVWLMRWRTQRLEAEKHRLESIVGERTAEIRQQRDEIVQQRDEIVKQKDEIEEKSKSLETALNELSTAQHELIRQEKMATVGKLTQGLIDRILNPLNYINNFAKLSQGLLKDVEANVDDEKDNMDQENYEDTKDVLSMLEGNLEKVSEHGQNTTRTLKAMEEMLKDRSGGIVAMELTNLLRQNEEMLRTYYANEIAQQAIDIRFDLGTKTVDIEGNPEQLSKTFMSLLGNAIYAVVKKAQKQQFKPEVGLSLNEGSDKVTLVFRDNGIGIEDTIIDRIFDPFFTTKTTGEAAGVGLYLSREIIQNHHGDISVRSVKDQYTEFTIELPKTSK